MNRQIKNPGKFWDKAWSLVDQCTPVSEGCRNCWLKTLNKRTGKPWDGNVTFRADRLDIPLHTKKPTVFAIWSDLYHEAVTDEQICEAFKVMWRCPQHTFLVVTKRPERVNNEKWEDIMSDVEGNPCNHPSNIYHLVTVENQEMADQRIPHALKIPGKVGLLIEPMLGPVDFSAITEEDYEGISTQIWPLHRSKFSFVILGGETGPKARPMHPDWARSVRDQCKAAGVPFFFKSNGEFITSRKAHDIGVIVGHQLHSSPWGQCQPQMAHVGAKKSGRLLDGQEHNDLPWRKA